MEVSQKSSSWDGLTLFRFFQKIREERICRNGFKINSGIIVDQIWMITQMPCIKGLLAFIDEFESHQDGNNPLRGIYSLECCNVFVTPVD